MTIRDPQFDFKLMIHTCQMLSESVNLSSDDIENVEKQHVKHLYELWNKKSSDRCVTQTKNFSEFVRRYSDDIFTRNIAKGLYLQICSGSFDG